MCAADSWKISDESIFIHELYYILKNVSYLCTDKLKTKEL
jgi:hypothetical protein